MSALFSALIAARNALYDRGAFKQQRLTRPVISIGNISVGGAGKTPFTILLAELLQHHGMRVDVLSRGYGRKSSGVLVVDAQGDAAQFGDEPVLIARRLREVPVIVAQRRYDAGLLAERSFQSDIHLLDDGFQHRQLARDFDIVLLSPRDLHDKLLPSGKLRENLKSLERADAIVWSEPGDLPSLPVSKPIWRVRRRIALPTETGARPFAFCAIAEPERFLRDLKAAGTDPVGHHWFRDHHAYKAADISEIRKAAERAGADGFLTTEKDAVKLGAFKAQLSKLGVVALCMELEEPQQAINFILQRLNASRSSR